MRLREVLPYAFYAASALVLLWDVFLAGQIAQLRSRRDCGRQPPQRPLVETCSRRGPITPSGAHGRPFGATRHSRFEITEAPVLAEKRNCPDAADHECPGEARAMPRTGV